MQPETHGEVALYWRRPGDGIVNSSDLAAIFRFVGSVSGRRVCPPDLNGDGIVTMGRPSDVSIHWTGAELIDGPTVFIEK
jgi:hypothetical protein